MSPLTSELRARHRVAPAVGGVVVTGVVPASPAAESGVEAGDIVVEAGRETVASPQQLGEKIAGARNAGRSVVLLTLNRGGELSFKALRFRQPNLEKALKTARR